MPPADPGTVNALLIAQDALPAIRDRRPSPDSQELYLMHTIQMAWSRTKAPLVACAIVVMLAVPSHAGAQSPLGSAKAFGVLGASTVTNTGPTTIRGNLGVSPGTAITGLASITLDGTVHAGDAVARRAQTDANSAFTLFSALPRTRDLSGMNLGGMSLTPGVYSFSSSAQLTGVLTLDFLGDPNSLFVFQIGSSLTTASLASVLVLNGGSNSGLYWLVGSSATLGTGTSFMGNLLARESITMTTGASVVCGRAIALTGAVTMDRNRVSNDCGAGDFGSGGFSGGIVPAVVPEPASILLLAAGLAGVGAMRWRRRTNQQPARSVVC